MKKTWTKKFIVDEKTCLTKDERKGFASMKKKKSNQSLNIKTLLKDQTIKPVHRVYWLRRYCLDNDLKLQEYAESKTTGIPSDALNFIARERGPLSTDEGVDELIDYLGL